MQLLEKTNMPKLLFALSLALAAVTAYSAYSFFTADRQLPVTPRTDRASLHKPDGELGQKMSRLDFDTFWKFGERDPFQPPRARISATGYFTITQQGGNIVVRASYDCMAIGRTDRIIIEYPAGWTFTKPQSDKMEFETLRRSVLVKFKEVQQGEFQISDLVFTAPLRPREPLEFPAIRIADAFEEKGFIGLQDTRTHILRPQTFEALEIVAQPPRQLERSHMTFRYDRHPYKLMLQLDALTVAATGYFTMTEQGENLLIRGGYRCRPSGPVQNLRIEFPHDWTFRPPRTDLADYRPTRGAVEVTLKKPATEEFNFPLEFSRPARGQREISFPSIRISSGAESEDGFLGVKSTEAFEIKPQNTQQLRAETSPPRQLGETDYAYRYGSHPYRLTLALTSLGREPVRPPPPPRTDTQASQEDDNGASTEVTAKYEMPFKFRGIVTVGERMALLEDKETGEIRRLRLGEIINNVEIVSIRATSIIVRDAEGTMHELKSSQDFD